MERETIVSAALEVLMEGGLPAVTTARVAKRAGCAKGLVNYHHGTKSKLLGEVAGRLVNLRARQRLAAFDNTGAEAIDRLWVTLNEAVTSGSTIAWLALMGSPESEISGAASWPPDFHEKLAASMAVSLGALLDEAQVRQVSCGLDGFEIALWQARGRDVEVTEEGYQKMWLSVL